MSAFDPIRPASPADLGRVREIVDAAYSHYIERLGKKPGPMLDDYAALIAAGKVSVYDRAGVLGILVLEPQADAMLLDNIAVAPQAQGQGVGEVLMAYAEQRARDAGFCIIRLYTHVLMTQNIGIYERAGYHETHRVEEKGYSRVYMEKGV